MIEFQLINKYNNCLEVLRVNTRTELHTHLIGMLSAKKFIEFLSKYDYEFSLNEEGKIDFFDKHTNKVNAKNMIKNQTLIEQLSIVNGNRINY